MCSLAARTLATTRHVARFNCGILSVDGNQYEHWNGADFSVNARPTQMMLARFVKVGVQLDF